MSCRSTWKFSCIVIRSFAPDQFCRAKGPLQILSTKCIYWQTLLLYFFRVKTGRRCSFRVSRRCPRVWWASYKQLWKIAKGTIGKHVVYVNVSSWTCPVNDWESTRKRSTLTSSSSTFSSSSPISLIPVPFDVLQLDRSNANPNKKKITDDDIVVWFSSVIQKKNHFKTVTYSKRSSFVERVLNFRILIKF